MKRRNFMIGLGGAAIAGLPTAVLGGRAPDRLGRSQKRTLLSTYVTNVDDVLGREAIPVEAAAPVRLRRIPDRNYDPQSIAVETVGGVQLGYVPTNMGRILAPMLDAGLPLKAQVIGTRSIPRPTIKIEIAIAAETAVEHRRNPNGNNG
jgi:glycerol-3-phosphate O-acyltransferase